MIGAYLDVSQLSLNSNTDPSRIIPTNTIVYSLRMLMLTSTFNPLPSVLNCFSSKLLIRNVKQTSNLSHVPLDILLLVVDHLTLPERILLSQSCQGLWRVLRIQCSDGFKQASIDEQRRCLAVLGDSLPDHRYCEACHRLHALSLQDLYDVPSATDVQYFGFCPALDCITTRHCMHRDYAVAFRHVQLAIKFTRLKQHHQNYRSLLLQDYVQCLPSYYSMSLQFQASPNIVDGRFLLMTLYTFQSDSMSIAKLLRAGVVLCPHLTLRQPDEHYLSLYTSVCDAFERLPSGLSKSSCCKKCPTDYSVKASKGGFEFNVWQDLGDGRSTKDPYWTSHLWSEIDSTKSDFDYEKGSIRKRWYKARPVRPRG